MKTTAKTIGRKVADKATSKAVALQAAHDGATQTVADRCVDAIIGNDVFRYQIDHYSLQYDGIAGYCVRLGENLQLVGWEKSLPKVAEMICADALRRAK